MLYSLSRPAEERRCVLTYKRAKQPGDEGFEEWPSGSRSYCFTRTTAPAGQCVRFRVDRAGDRFFLAADYTILA